MMRTFRDAAGRAWVASAREEDTPRHHGRWYLVLHPEDEPDAIHAIPEVRWQTDATAVRTLRTMSDFELRRRLRIVRGRGGNVATPLSSGLRRDRSSASAG
jgi:hypothetical protein